MALEGMGECHEGEFAQSIDPLRFRLCFLRISRRTNHTFHEVQIKFRPDVTGACRKDNSHIAVRGLHTQCRTEDTQEVEIGEVIHLPFLVNAVGGLFPRAGR